MGELTIYGEGTRVGLAFFSTAIVRRYLQHGCAEYLADMVDTREEKKLLISNVPIV